MTINRDLFWKLLEPEHVGAVMFCRKLMRNKDKGDDLYQDGLLLAYKGFEDLKDTTSFRPWFYRILVNTFKSTVRRPWWKRRVPLTPEITQTLTVNSPAGASDARLMMKRAFEAISPRDQALVTLYELEEWTISELSELLGISAGAVKSRLFRSRQKMKKALSRLTFGVEKRSSTAINLAEEKP